MDSVWTPFFSLQYYPSLPPFRALRCLAGSADAHSRPATSSPSPQVLDRVSQMLITSPAAVKKAFERVDRSRSGSLNPSGVAEFLRELFKDLRPRDVHYLLQVRGGYGGE